MKKIITLFICFILFLGMTVSAQESNLDGLWGSEAPYDIVTGMGIVANIEKDSTLTVKILKDAYFKIAGTEYELTGEDDEATDIETVSEVFVSLLGYSIQKTRDNSYYSIANSLGLFKNLTFSHELTVGDFSAIFVNALEAKMLDPLISNITDTYVKTDETFLNRYFNATVYTVTVNSVILKGGYIKATVNSIEDTINKAKYYKNEIINFRLEDASYISNFEDMKITAFINSDGKVLYWYPKSDSELIYSYISAVNGSENEERSYFGRYISNVELAGKKYSLSSTCKITYNEKNALNSSNKYVGNFVKAIIQGGKIANMEVYALTEGGRIISYSEDTIAYEKGMGENRVIKNIADFEIVTVVINGRISALSALKEGMIADFYKSVDRLVIVGADYTVSDYLKSVSDEYAELSSSEYKFSSMYNTYFSNQSGDFGGTSDYLKLLNCYCDFYFDYKGEIRYVRLSEKAESNINAEYFALLTGITTKNDIFSNNGYTLKFYKLINGTYDEVIADTKDDIKLPKSLDEIKGTLNIRTSMDKNFYLLKENAEGVIVSIKNPEDEKEVFVTEKGRYVQYSDMSGLSVSPEGGGGLFGNWYSDKQNIYAITIVDGDTKIMPAVTSGELPTGGIYYGYITVINFVSEMASKSDLTCFWGSYVDDGLLYSYDPSNGIVTDVSKVYDEKKGEVVNRYTILRTSGKTLTFDAPTGTEFDILKKGFLFSYKDGMSDNPIRFSNYPIYLGPYGPSHGREINGSGSEGEMLKVDILDSTIYSNALDYTNEIDAKKNSGSAITVVTNKTQMYKDTIYKYTDKRIWFGNKNLYGVGIVSSPTIFKVDLNEKTFDIVDKSELYGGRDIYFYFGDESKIDFIFIFD